MMPRPIVAAVLCGLLAASIADHAVAAPFSYSADGQEATDLATGLVWRRCAEGMAWNGSACAGSALTFTHEGALGRAATQATITGRAWRLPNVKELNSIANPRNDPAGFSSTTAPFDFWSSTPFVEQPFSAWVVSSNGVVDTGLRSQVFFVRLVRSGP